MVRHFYPTNDSATSYILIIVFASGMLIYFDIMDVNFH